MEIIGRAIKSINDINLENEIEGLELVRKLQPPVVNRLYEEYEKIQVKQNESLTNLDEIKN